MADRVGDREAEAAKRRVVATRGTLVRVQDDSPLGGEEHPGAVDVEGLLDAQAEQVTGDRLDRHPQLGAAEEAEVALTDGVRARILVRVVCHGHVHPVRLGAGRKEAVYLVGLFRGWLCG